jgi:hypothetical protein
MWACTLEPIVQINCGDGFVDEEAGEECERSLPETFEGACLQTNRPQGTAACDEQTCQIVADDLQCAKCGDGIADPSNDEECDGNDFVGTDRCPFNTGALRCTSDCEVDDSQCPTCGNGDVDANEECDPNATDQNDIGTEVFCAGSGLGAPILTPPLPSPVKPYTSGTATMCRDDCLWNRIGCGYCGDRNLDENTVIDFDGQTLAKPEVCDGDRIDLDELTAQQGAYAMLCAAESEANDLNLRPNFSCNSTCDGFESHVGAGEACCVVAGELCPSAATGYQCCFAYSHPTEDPCESPLLGGGVVGLPVCRPVSLAPG